MVFGLPLLYLILQQGNKMQPEPSIRIIYLKNSPKQQENQSFHMCFANYPQNLIYNQRLTNLVNLSAKIQQQSPNKSANEHNIRRIIQKTHQEVRIQHTLVKHNHIQTISEKSQLVSEQKDKIRQTNHLHIEANINRQSRLNSLKQKDKSIINLLGNIEFKGIKKHKRTQQNIFNIKNACISQRNSQTLSPYKEIDKKREQMHKNTPQLLNDFNIFLQNKRLQNSKLQLPKIYDEEGIRIKKLATINPQQVQTTRNQEKLNLYSFLKNQQYEIDFSKAKISGKQKSKDNINFDQVLQALIDPSKSRQQFQWSKFTGESKKSTAHKDKDVVTCKDRF